jgi:hypothetical protein
MHAQLACKSMQPLHAAARRRGEVEKNNKQLRKKMSFKLKHGQLW